MNWYELAALILGAGGIGGLIATIANVIQARRKSKSDEKGSKIEQSQETLTLIDALYQKQIQWMSERMDSNDSVRKQEFSDLRSSIDKRFDTIEKDNNQQNDLLRDIKEYLNGGFAAFEESKHKPKGKKR